MPERKNEMMFVSEPPVERAEGGIEYPVLSVYDLGDKILDPAEVPEDIKAHLQPHEQVIHIHAPNVIYPHEPPSAIKAIKGLTNVEQLADMGKAGPSIASLSTAENKGVAAMTKYEVVHGRDALRVAFDLYDRYPVLMTSTIISLAEQQGLEDEDYEEDQPLRQEERGKIMLLNRDENDPVGQRFSQKLGWGWPFYGSIDATPSFITAIALQCRQEQNLLEMKFVDRSGAERTVKDALDLAVEWLLTKTKPTETNPEGLLEYKNKAPKGKGGIVNQAWKDSAGAYVHADGTWANHNKGIASLEVQGMAYDAFMYAAEIYRQLGESERANELDERARALRQVVLDKFWVQDDRGGYFALGSDRDDEGNLRILKVRTSNMGQLLNTQLLKGDELEVKEKVEATVKTLFSKEMLSRWGIRTLSNKEAAYRKEGYHVGSVWLWDNDCVGAGLENHGYHGLARYLWGLSLEVIEHTKMFPEFIQGDDNATPILNQREVYVWDKKHEVLHLFEQLPQQIQAWSVSSALTTKYKNFFVQLKEAKDPIKKKLEKELLQGLPALTLY